ncbi:hypothetical protein ACROYT_G028068 [Oculina patagonica]
MSTTPETNFTYPVEQETPETFLLAIQELGQRLVSNSEDMERRIAERFQTQIDHLGDKIWRMENGNRAEPGTEPELRESAREPEVGRGEIGRRFLVEKPLITPSLFDGKSSWEDYQVQFELIAELNGWDTSVMAIFLAASLSGSAQAVLSDLDESSRKDYHALKGALALRFGNGGQKELFRSELKNRMRQKGETLPELSQAIQRLVRQAYPDAPQSVREVMERDHFLDAIPDTDIRWKVLQARPKNLHDSLIVATEVEAFRKSELQRLRQSNRVVSAVGEQVVEPVENLDSAVNRMINEIKGEREVQRKMMEDFMSQVAGSCRVGRVSLTLSRAKSKVLTRLQRENSELTRVLKASGAEEGDILSTGGKVQESCHKVDELSELSWGKESMIKHSRPQLGERLRSLQNIQKQLEESGRKVLMVEAQLGNLGAVDLCKDQKAEVENPNENLRLKQETVQHLSRENKRLRTKLEDTNEGNELVEDTKGKIDDLTRVLDFKRKELCHFYELQNGKVC